MTRKFVRFLYLISFVIPTKTSISKTYLAVYVQFLKSEPKVRYLLYHITALNGIDSKKKS